MSYIPVGMAEQKISILEFNKRSLTTSSQVCCLAIAIFIFKLPKS
ncbi:hypothetical protein [Nostoc sp.]